MPNQPLTFFSKAILPLRWFFVFVIWLISFGSGFSQSFEEKIFETFRVSQSQKNQSKLYIHLDRRLFLQKDNLIFHAVEVDAFEHKPIEISLGMKVEILDQEGNIMESSSFPFQNSVAQGMLPINLNPGRYVLMAYTESMQDLKFAFFRGITIVESSTDINDTGSGLHNLNIFPEGGSLIEGLESQLVIEAQDADCKGVSIKGNIMDSKNQIAGYFETNDLGLAKVPFSPKKQESYVIIPQNDPETRFPFREISPAGTTCKVLNLSNREKLILEVNSKSTYPLDSLAILIHHQTGPLILEKHPLNQGKLILEVPYSLLSLGLHQLEVFDLNGGLLTKRLFYIDIPIEKVELTLLSEEGQSGIQFNKTASEALPFGVMYVGFEGERFQNLGLGRFLHLRNQFYRDFELLEYFDQMPNDLALSLLDQLLITVQESVLDKRHIENTNIPFEYNGGQYRIKFKEERSGNPVSNTSVMLLSDALPNFLEEGMTDEEGVLQINQFYFADSAIFNFKIPDLKKKPFSTELLKNGSPNRKEFMPKWVDYADDNRNLNFISFRQSLDQTTMNTSGDFELEEFIVTGDRREFDVRYKNLMPIKADAKIKKVDENATLHPHPLKLVEDMGVTLIPTNSGYRAEIRGRGPSVFWDGIRLSHFSHIDMYHAKEVEEVVVYPAGAIAFYSRRSYEQVALEPSSLVLKGYKSLEDFAPFVWFGSSVFWPVGIYEEEPNILKVPNIPNANFKFYGIDIQGKIFEGVVD